MKRLSVYCLTALVVVIMGCVVIPDTFEADISIEIRHVEEQAESVLDFVEGKSDTLAPVLEEGGAEESSSSFQQKLRRLVDPMPAAHAQDDMKVDSPLIKQIAQKMRDRFSKLQPLKDKGALGENNRGYVELVDDSMLSGDEKNEAQRLVAAENEDRKALYQEFARLNQDQNLSVSTIESVYAYKRLERANAGEIFQLPPEGEYFDKFKQTPAAQKLGSDAQPGAWVTIK